MTFKRRWAYPGSLNDSELVDVLALAFSDPDIRELLVKSQANTEAVRLGNADRDRALEDVIGAAALRVTISKFPAASLNDGREIAQHLFAEIARRLENKKTTN